MNSSETTSPRVAVLMPAYNQAEYVADALNSLLKQTYSNWDCAVVDDGSPDNVAEIVEPFCQKDNRIKFFHTENHGLPGARNFAASVTDSEFIIPLDADDTFEPEYIEKCVETFLNFPETRVVRCDWRFFGLNKPTPPLIYKGYRDLLMNNSIFCSAMFRREDFLRVGGYDEKIPYAFEDWEFWIRLLAPINWLNDKDYATSSGKEKNISGNGMPGYEIAGTDGNNEIPGAGVVRTIPMKLFNYRIKKVSMSTEAESERKATISLSYIYCKNIEIYNRAFPDMLVQLKKLNILNRRLEKWKRRNVFSRLWYAVTGRF